MRSCLRALGSFCIRAIGDELKKLPEWSLALEFVERVGGLPAEPVSPIAESRSGEEAGASFSSGAAFVGIGVGKTRLTRSEPPAHPRLFSLYTLEEFFMHLRSRVQWSQEMKRVDQEEALKGIDFLFLESEKPRGERDQEGIVRSWRELKPVLEVSDV